MNKNWLISSLIFFLFISVQAQQYSSAFAINPLDSSELTASHLLDDGHIITASLVKTISVPGGSGLPDLSSIGEIVLRKLTPQGSPVWEVDFPNSIAHIMHIKTASNGDVLVSGAYRDTLQFSPSQVLYAEQFRANSFIASYDSQGNFKWVYSTTPNPNYSKFYHVFDLKNDKIYLPYAINFNTETRVQILDLQGDSVGSRLLSNDHLLVSQFKFNQAGELYLCGTSDLHADLGGSPIGTDSTTFGYGTFVGKLDTAFQQMWSDEYRYVTFDLYPRVAFTSNRVAFYVDTMPLPNGIGNYHMLKYYDLYGNVLNMDSVGPGIFSQMSRAMDLISDGENFIYATIGGFDTIVIKKVDSLFNHTRLASIRMSKVFMRPWFVKNDSVVLYNHCFTDSIAVVNDIDTVWNAKTGSAAWYNYQQMLVKFSKTPSTIGIKTRVDVHQKVNVFPNPSQTGELNLQFAKPIAETISLDVLTLEGRFLKHFVIEKGTLLKKVTVSDLPNGTYILQIKSSSENLNQKWIKN